VDALRTVGFALTTLDAMIWLSFTRHYPFQRNQILSTMIAVFRIAHTHWQ
jgi:hypothetical protein